MHAAAAVLLTLAGLTVAYKTFLRCARNQSASFRDRADPHRKIVYQPLPSTNV